MHTKTWYTHIFYSNYKIIAPNNEDTPAKCKLNIAKSTEPSPTTTLNGGYIVQPEPTPAPMY